MGPIPYRRGGRMKAAGIAGLMILISLAIAAASLAAPGDSDPSFGTGGLVTTDLGAYDAGRAVAVQADGKIVAVGSTGEFSGGDFAVTRYNADGSLDSSLSGDGVQTTDFGGFDSAEAVAVQTDGKIVVAGLGWNATTRNFDFAVVRYNTDGSLDASFSTDGTASVDFGGPDELGGLAIQADGKIVVAGGGGAFKVDDYFALARFNSDGSLDSTFSGDGKQTIDFGGDDQAEAVALQADGKIVAAGLTRVPNFVSGRFAIARVAADGSLDSTFSNDGKQTTDLIGDGIQDLAIQTDGKIVAVGDGLDTEDFAVVRYDSTGSLDPAFAGDGIQTTDLGSGDRATSVALQPDGKLLVAGNVFFAPSDEAVLRYRTDGSLDTGFSGDGRQAINFGSNGVIADIALQPDGKLLVFGSWAPGIAGADFALARLEGGDPPPDVTPPETTITSGPEGVTAAVTPMFSFSSSETASTYECRLDGGAFAACATPYTGPALSEGAHTFEVRAIDPAGNVDPSPAARAFTVQLPPTSPPTTGTSSPPPAETSGGSAPNSDPAAPAPPRITGLRLSRKTIRLSGPTRLGQSALMFGLSRAARVTIAVSRIKGGIRLGSRCVAPRTSGVGGARCDLPVAKLSRSLSAGKNRISLTARIGGSSLRPGSYRLTVIARADGRRSTAARVTLHITL